MLDIVIVNWNSDDQLRDCIKSIVTIVDNKRLIGNIIIVDNGSTDGSQLGLKYENVPVILIQNSNNLGFAAACNQGGRLGSSKYLLFLNPDTRLCDGSLKIPLLYLEQNDHCGIAGIQLVDEFDRIARTCSRFPSTSYIFNQCFGLNRLFPKYIHGVPMLEWDHTYTRIVDQVMGAFFLVRRSLYESLKCFDERFFIYYEEVDFCYRAKKLGYHSIYLVGAKAYHKGGGSTSKVLGKRLFYTLNSRLIYGFKNFTFVSAWFLFFLSVFIEPLVRLLQLLITSRFREIKYLFEGYYLLWREFKNVIRVGMRARNSRI